ncbi:MAG: hypothetical protein ABSA96_20540 [Candidatus Acidiferrales bacterium]|jgi:uncharacterized protein YycO
MAEIPLTPTDGGGLCIDDRSLSPGDIIVSTEPTSKSIQSGAIRFGTGSAISHAALYTGQSQVIEAIGSGVRRTTLSESLRDHDLAVGYRVRGLTGAKAIEVIAYANKLAQPGAKYDLTGALSAGVSRPRGYLICVVALGIMPCTAAALAGQFKSSDKFYCSQLVLEAFRRAGASFISADPHSSVPQDIPEAYSRGKLLYVGHLLA